MNIRIAKNILITFGKYVELTCSKINGKLSIRKPQIVSNLLLILKHINHIYIVINVMFLKCLLSLS